MDKLFDKVMVMEYLAKYLLACGIGVNLLMIAWVLGKIIIVIGSL